MKDGRVGWGRGRFRPMASDVSALSRIVANGHQVVPTFPPPPRFVPYGEFSQVGDPALSHGALPPPSWGTFDGLGATHKEAGRAWSFVRIRVPAARQPVSRDTFKFQLLKDKLHAAEQRDGHYLLRGFSVGEQAAPLWERYMQLTEIEAAFKRLKSDLHLRPIRQRSTLAAVDH